MLANNEFKRTALSIVPFIYHQLLRIQVYGVPRGSALNCKRWKLTVEYVRQYGANNERKCTAKFPLFITSCISSFNMSMYGSIVSISRFPYLLGLGTYLTPSPHTVIIDSVVSHASVSATILLAHTHSEH
jgi:hypothetical protein